MSDIEFIGRREQLDMFNKFLNSDIQIQGKKDKYARLLLVVGHSGMGKKALLQKMMEQANKQNHYCFFVEDINNGNYTQQIQGLIKSVRKNKRRFPVHWTDVAELVIVAASSTPAAPAAKIANFLLDIVKRRKASEQGDKSLACILLEKLEKLSNEIPDTSRIVIFIYPTEDPLNPDEENPKEIVPLLNSIGAKVPNKVRLVIAQRPHSVVIDTVKSGGADENLKNMCAEPMRIKKMNEAESREFIKQYDTEHILNEAMTQAFLKRYDGWPRHMYLALKELETIPGEITEETIRNLPEDVNNYWKKRYDELDKIADKKYVETVSLLPHPYTCKDVEEFGKLSEEESGSVKFNRPPVDRLIKILEKYKNKITGADWDDCPDLIDTTAKECVVKFLNSAGSKSLYYKRLEDIASHYGKKIENNYQKADKDTLTYLFKYLMNAKKWDKIGELLANIEFLKKKQEKEEQYKFQNEFINLLNSDIPDDELKKILEKTLRAIKQMPDGKEKADWLDIFAYWINNFGVKDKTTRSTKLKEVAIKFDEECGEISKRLVDSYEKKKEHGWAMRFAELRTWVYQRAGEYDKCIEACEAAEKMSLQRGMDEAYRYLGHAEFIRIRAYALMKLFEKTKETKYKDSARKAYEELTTVFPADGGESPWPGTKEWDELEEYLMTNADKTLPIPSQAVTGQSRAFKAQIVSNLDDCISAMHLIRFFRKHGGTVKWIHHKKFKAEQFAPVGTLFTVLVGSPKAPGVSNVAYDFYKYDKKNFLEMYSGLKIEAYRLKTEKGKTHCYMLGSVSKINTLKAAYDFTKDPEVKRIIEE